MKPSLYVFGAPGQVGGAATRIRDLLPLLKDDFDIRVVFGKPGFLHDRWVTNYLEALGIPGLLRKDLPKRAEGVALGVCELDFFSSGAAERVRQSGLRLMWSNEMMWPFEGEPRAAAEGMVDRVLFVSDLQRQSFGKWYGDTDQRLIPNFVAPESFPAAERASPGFVIGRLSRPDPVKYPADFPVFYEELGLSDVTYRVQAWSDELRKAYRWHQFGPEWELLPSNKLPAAKLLQSLDLFVYPLGHRVVESWGRSTVEAMLTGAIPVVPAGHQFHQLMVHGESGFICSSFGEFRDCVQNLHRDGRWRARVSRQAAHHARTVLCDRELHRRMWIEALTFN